MKRGIKPTFRQVKFDDFWCTNEFCARLVNCTTVPSVKRLVGWYCDALPGAIKRNFIRGVNHWIDGSRASSWLSSVLITLIIQCRPSQNRSIRVCRGQVFASSSWWVRSYDSKLVTCLLHVREWSWRSSRSIVAERPLYRYSDRFLRRKSPHDSLKIVTVLSKIKSQIKKKQLL